MPRTITRKFEWDSGHRVLNHEGKCRHLHGHRYVAEITVSAPALDTLGRVIDFSVLKTEIGEWIDQRWDHNMLLNSDDPLLQQGFNAGDASDIALELVGRDPYIFYQMNPTAENIAKVLYGIAVDQMAPYGISVHNVRIWETPNCYADYSL